MAHPIRLATSEDTDAVASLLIAFRNWWGRDEPSDESFHESVRRLLADPNTEYLLGGDPAAGVCQLRYRYGVWLAAEDCLLEDLYVTDAARGSGLGRALTEAALARARRRGCGRVELDVNEANPAALALYESLGFESFSDPPGGRNLLMRRRL
jgi:ribosomal protein S18 acetylase RimI-like enzyme